MTRLSFEVTDELGRAIASRAREAGYASVEAYLQSIVEADVHAEVAPELEDLLLQGLQSPAREVTDADWQQRESQLRKRFST